MNTSKVLFWVIQILYFLPVHRFRIVIAHGLAYIPPVMSCEFYTTGSVVICWSWIQSHDHNTQNFISPSRKNSSVTSSPSIDFSLADKFIHLIKKMGQCKGVWPSDGLILDNDVFRVSYFYDYGIYAGFKSAKTAHYSKGWIQGARKWWSELSNWLQVLQRFVFFVAVLADSWKISSEVTWV